MAKVSTLYDSALYTAGVPFRYGWDTGNPLTAHWLVSGASGSGKSWYVLSLLAEIASTIPNALLYCVDFKGSKEYAWLRKIPGARYWYHSNSLEGVTAFYEQFEQRLQADTFDNSPPPLFLYIDEYTSMYSYYAETNAKEGKRLNMMFSNLLFMGRGIEGGAHILCSVQRPDSSLGFSDGKRDQFGVRLYLGKPSPQAAEMMFGDRKNEISPDFAGGVGVGHLLMEGQAGLACVRTPHISDMQQLQKEITRIVT